jgi:hypothetical protein
MNLKAARFFFKYYFVQILEEKYAVTSENSHVTVKKSPTTMCYSKSDVE